MVMIMHAKNLAIPDVSKEEPNSYVKVRDLDFDFLR